MPVTLTARERAHLKARARALEPVVHVGNAGLTGKVAGRRLDYRRRPAWRF